ncbi:MAG: hypothetical protein JXR69_08410 [Candidatus Delongbacteria bacterium]|nr:hypothetical protein [Candidatus Delongbacteria bacterium]
MLQTIIHNSLHILIPGMIAWFFFNSKWKSSWLIMLAAYLIDLDHLLATPIFDPARCSIGFHPLHSYYAIGIYLILSFIPKTRIIGIGLMIHIFVDLTDCLWINYFN